MTEEELEEMLERVPESHERFIEGVERCKRLFSK